MDRFLKMYIYLMETNDIQTIKEKNNKNKRNTFYTKTISKYCSNKSSNKSEL